MHYEVKSVRLAATGHQKKMRRTLGERLTEALQGIAQNKARLARYTEKSWASITFAGSRHSFELVFEGEEAIAAGEILIAELPEHEFAIPGQLVADAAIIEVCHTSSPPVLTVTCDLLMVEEG